MEKNELKFNMGTVKFHRVKNNVYNFMEINI